jgi:hypothetical protein
VDDLKLIVAVGISTINFNGIVGDDDSEAVRFINELNTDSILLEIIQLQEK